MDSPTGRRTIVPCYLSIAEWSDPGRTVRQSLGTTSKCVLMYLFIYLTVSVHLSNLLTNTDLVVPLVRDDSYVPYVQGCSRSCPKHTCKLAHLHVPRPGSQIRKIFQHTAVLQLYMLCGCAYVPKGCYR